MRYRRQTEDTLYARLSLYGRPRTCFESFIDSINAFNIYGRMQVLPEALETVLAGVRSFDVSGNQLHCNCELSWLRRWLGSAALASRHPDDARSLRCHGSSATPASALLHSGAR